MFGYSVHSSFKHIIYVSHSEYADILAAQGRVHAALRYLSFLNDPVSTKQRRVIV
jgi:hypothetical protein